MLEIESFVKFALRIPTNWDVIKELPDNCTELDDWLDKLVFSFLLYTNPITSRTTIILRHGSRPTIRPSNIVYWYSSEASAGRVTIVPGLAYTEWMRLSLQV
jgi:hypothetical protein